jgi:Uma2 family endonuclease
LGRALEKAKYYLSWGSQGVWIIDPQQRTAWVCSRDAAPVWIPPDGALNIGDTSIPLMAVFQQVDDALDAADE